MGDDILELAASSTHLYPFLSTGNSVRLLELPKAGGSALELHQIGGSNIDVGSIAPEPGAVYFTSGQNAGGGATAYRWTGTKTELYPAGGFMRATATHLYWNNSGNIRRAAKTVGAPLEQVVSAGTAVDVFEIEGNELVYSYDDRVSLYRVPLTPPFLAIELNPTVVDADFVYDEIAIDASFAYVMADTPDNSTVSTIYRIPRAGGAAVAFIENQPAGRALAQDADYIYWSALYPCGASCGKKLIVRKKK